MPRTTYLIVGAGMAADAAVKGIREIDQTGSVSVLGLEPHKPYARPPLSKKLWLGAPEDSIWCGTEASGAAVFAGCRAVALDVAQHEVRDQRGEVHRYDKLLLATGGTPRRLPFAGDDICYFRTLDDYRRLRALAKTRKSFVVLGGGFIGSELAAALAHAGRKVTVLLPGSGLCERVFPAVLSAYVTTYFREHGVTVLTGETAAELRRDGDRKVVLTSRGRELAADEVVAGIGVSPATELAELAGLPLDDGVAVDELLRAGSSDVFAAGDVASFYNPILKRRLRVEHEDNAVSMGRQAGRNMAGAEERYHHLPFFYSDLFDLGYEAVGDVDGRLETLVDWREPYREGVIYYVERARLRGVLLWNVWGRVDAARRLISRPEPFLPSEMRGLLDT